MLNVSIDFAESHWFFPKIVITCIVIVLAVILVKERKTIAQSIAGFSFKSLINHENYKAYIFVALISVYILLMEALGEVFPNTGYAFLIATVPLLFVIPLLIEKELTKRKITIMAINAVISPIVAWVVLGQMFGITLP